MSTVFNEDTQYLSIGGLPYVGGKIYIGVVDTDPVKNPVTIYGDRGLTTPIANPQPIDATGRASAKIWVDGKYSLQINDVDGAQVFQDLDRGENTNNIPIIGLSNVSGGNTITANASPVLTAYVDRALYPFKAQQTVTGPTTLNIDGVGAKPIVQNNDIPLGAGGIRTDDNVWVSYSAENDNFAIVNQKTNLVGYRSIASNDTLDANDLGFLIDCTNDLTLALTAAATLGAGFSFFVKANGGIVTIDPNGAQTIDGEATLELFDGQYAEITCDGTNFHTVMLPKSELRYRATSAATTVEPSDLGRLIDCTARTVLTLNSAATLGIGFFFWVKGNGGSVGINPNGSETIDGLATKAIASGSSTLIVCDGFNFHTATTATAAWPGQFFGLNTSNGADPDHDVNVALGQASSDDVLAANIVTMNLLTSAGKKIDASWVVGGNVGGLDTGTVANNSWYHIFLIMRTDTGVVDVLISLSPTSPTMPTGYDKKRRIGSVLTDGSANIIGYTQTGDEFLWDTPILDINVTFPPNTAVTRTLSIPTGINVLWSGVASLDDPSIAVTSYAYISPLTTDDDAAILTNSQVHCVFTGATSIATNSGSSPLEIRTNNSAQVRTRISLQDPALVFSMNTIGWVDTRGREF
ncbi:MAG: hypothetical protein COA96_10140 [SAR86 cluster bacterium]|uniref:Uncharacterized protein n=1 Tax=SAR86 cluster bacterium TaxID=2030880 RepID=A0A2A5AXY9_9GAMM|nr:MAG: hypothetical protein COA96_10140 [SAR86 cluster bacterium]